MKIVQIVGSINPHIGGKERFAGELTRELLRLGHDVTLITYDRKYKVDINCDIRYCHVLELSGFPPIPSFKDLIRQLDKEFDICHLHYHALFGEIAAFACKLRNNPLIITIHDEMKRNIYKIVYDRLLLSTISHLSDRIICLSNGIKNALIKRGMHQENIVIIPNAMHVKEIQNKACKIEKVMFNDKEFDLLFVGRLEKRKGVQYLLRALSILKEEGFKPTLRIVGDGVYKPKLRSLLREHDLSSQIVFTGYIPRKELLNHYLHARCVVIPSLYEGIPSVMIEALALGKPIITTSIPGMEDIKSKKLGFTVPPKDSKALAQAISKALSLSDEELSRIKLKAGKFVERYDWKFVVKQIISLYEECVER